MEPGTRTEDGTDKWAELAWTERSGWGDETGRHSTRRTRQSGREDSAEALK